MHISRILLALVALPLSVHADDVRSDLQTARKAFAEAKSTAEKQLIAAMSAAIKSTAKSGDLKVLQTLVAQRSAFRTSGELPTSPAFQSSVAAYKQAVKTAETALRTSYDAAIRKLKTANRTAAVAKLEAELKSLLKAGGALPMNLPEPKGNVKQQLAATLKPHQATLEAANKKAGAAFAEEVNRSIRAAAEGERFAEVKQLFALKKAFEDTGEVPLKSPKSVQNAVKRLTTARKSAIKTYEEELMSAATKAKNEKRHQLYYAILAAKEGRGDSRWIVIFRGTDPRIWNTDYAGSRGFARKASTLPDNVTFLRIASPKLNQAVIIPFKKAYFADPMRKLSTFWGWSATIPKTGAVMLGVRRRSPKIYVADSAKHRGKVGLLVDGRIYSGYGFGYLIPDPNTQGYTWAGQTLRPTVFTISVTNKPLNASEQKLLLK